MKPKTVVDSVTEVAGPPPDLAGLDEALDGLRHRFPNATFGRYLDLVPRVATDAYIAPRAVIIGAVTLGAQSSVWPGCILRADVAAIEVRPRSNLQDGVVVHLGDHNPTFVAEEVVVGHRAVLHGCHIGAGTLVGIGATVLDGARVGHGCVIAAGALVTPGAEIPARSLVIGTPGKVVRQLSATDEQFHRNLAGKYVRLAHNYRVG